MTSSWLISTGLTNAALATLLALVALAISRLVRSPALTHLLWIVVLLKLFTPPLFHVPVGIRLAILPDNWASAARASAFTDDWENSPSKTTVVGPVASPPLTATTTSDLRHESVQQAIASSGRDFSIARPRSAHRQLA